MIFSRSIILGVISLLTYVLADSPPESKNHPDYGGPDFVQFRPDQLTLSPKHKITDKPTTRTYNWVIEKKRGAPDGFYRDMLVVNGQYPGPTIEANEGDTIIVNVKNKLNKVGTSVHWHGMLQKGTAWMDGPAGVTQCPIPAGGSFEYKFKIEGQYGTYWWHAHAGAQLSDGIHGALIVHSTRDPLKRGKHYDYDQILIMSDWYHNTSAQIVTALDTQQGYQGSQAAPPPVSAMFNGFGTWDCKKFGTPGKTCSSREPYVMDVVPDKKYRLRLINTASHAMIWNSVDKHTLNVIEADDCPISSPAVNNLHRVKSHNGQRYSVILKTDKGKPGDVFWMRGEMHTECFPYITPDFANTTLAVLRYIDEKPHYKPTTKLPKTKDWKDALGADCRDIDTSALVPMVKEDAPKVAKQQGMFATNFGRLQREDGVNVTRFFVNNVTFNHQWYRPILYDVAAGREIGNNRISNLTFDKSGAADIIINNRDPIDHPYHAHGEAFWIVGEGTGALTMDQYKNTKFNTTNPLRRDTHVVPARSWSVLRIKADDPGVWFLHCHIDWHLTHGFAGVLIVQPDVVRKFKIPQASKELCKHLPPGQNINSTSLGRRDGHHKRQFSHDLSGDMH